MKWLSCLAISCTAHCLPQLAYSQGPREPSHRSAQFSYDGSEFGIYPRDSRADPQANAGPQGRTYRYEQLRPDPVSAGSSLRITQGGFVVYNPYLTEQQQQQPDLIGSSYPPEFATQNFSTVNLFRRPYQGYTYESVYPLNALPPERHDLRGPIRVEAIGRPEPYYNSHLFRPWTPPGPTAARAPTAATAARAAMAAMPSRGREPPPPSYIHRARPDLAAPQHVVLSLNELQELYSSESENQRGSRKTNTAEGDLRDTGYTDSTIGAMFQPGNGVPLVPTLPSSGLARNPEGVTDRGILSPAELLDLMTPKEPVSVSSSQLEDGTHSSRTANALQPGTFWHASAASVTSSSASSVDRMSGTSWAFHPGASSVQIEPTSNRIDHLDYQSPYEPWPPAMSPSFPSFNREGLDRDFHPLSRPPWDSQPDSSHLQFNAPNPYHAFESQFDSLGELGSENLVPSANLPSMLRETDEYGISDTEGTGSDENTIKQSEGAAFARPRHRFRSFSQPTRLAELEDTDSIVQTTRAPFTIPSFIHRHPWPFTLPASTTPEPVSVEVVEALESELHRREAEEDSSMSRSQPIEVGRSQPVEVGRSPIGFLIDRRHGNLKTPEIALNKTAVQVEESGNPDELSAGTNRNTEGYSVGSLHNVLLMSGFPVKHSINTAQESQIQRKFPSLDIPSRDVPSLNVPFRDVPSLNVPSRDVPSPNVPSRDVPSLNVPSRDVPSLNVPSRDVPSLDVPSLDIPSPSGNSLISHHSVRQPSIGFNQTLQSFLSAYNQIIEANRKGQESQNKSTNAPSGLERHRNPEEAKGTDDEKGTPLQDSVATLATVTPSTATPSTTTPSMTATVTPTLDSLEAEVSRNNSHDKSDMRWSNSIDTEGHSLEAESNEPLVEISTVQSSIVSASKLPTTVTDLNSVMEDSEPTQSSIRIQPSSAAPDSHLELSEADSGRDPEATRGGHTGDSEGAQRSQVVQWLVKGNKQNDGGNADDTLKEESIEKEEALKKESIEKEEALKEESIENEDTLKEEATLKQESIEKDGTLREEGIEKEDTLKEEGVEKEDTKQGSIAKEDTLKEASIAKEDTLKQDNIEKEDTLKEETMEEENENKSNLNDEKDVSGDDCLDQEGTMAEQDDPNRVAEGIRSRGSRSRWSLASAASRIKQHDSRITYVPLEAAPSSDPSEQPAQGAMNGLLGAGSIEVNKTGLLPFEAPTAIEFVDEEESPEISVLHSRSAQSFVSSSQAVAFPELGDGATAHPAPDVFSYCYPFTAEEILTKCSTASETEAVGVYIPMMVEIQLKHDPDWYEKMKELQKKHHLEIIGIAYEAPNWELITEILTEHPKLFSGVMLEWVGPEACISEIPLPTEEQLEILANQTTRNILRYLIRDQNFSACRWTRPTFLANSMKREKTLERLQTVLPIPERLQPVFACFGGQEGLCFSAFNRYPHLVCESDQRYSFNPYESAGGRMMHLFNETCAGLPPHDYYGTL